MTITKSIKHTFISASGTHLNHHVLWFQLSTPDSFIMRRPENLSDLP